MRYRRFMIILMMAVFIFGIASVCAGEVDDATTAIENTTPLESSIDDDVIGVDDSQEIGQTGNDEIISEVETGTFTELRGKISDAGDGSTITLDKNYEYDGNGRIPIGYSNIIIDGKGHILDAKKQTDIFYVTGINVTIKNITFTNANYLAIYWASDGGSVFGCAFINNTADDYGIGGAIYWNGYGGSVSGCAFINNTAYNGGAIYWLGDGGSVSGCAFISNTAEVEGGAIVWLGDGGSVSGCAFISNTAENDGGAIDWIGAGGSVSGCAFISNTADRYGGAIYANRYLPGEYCWFGNDASNYKDSPPTYGPFYCDLILFLNATVESNALQDLSTSDIIFKLYLYNSSSEIPSEYDNAPFENLNFTITSTNGVTDKDKVKLGEKIKYTKTNVGKSTLTASIGNAQYTIELNNMVNPMLSIPSQEVYFTPNTIISLNYNSNATGKVNITLNGKNGNSYTFTDLDINTSVSLAEIINADEYDVTVVYSGDDNFVNATAEGTLKVNKANSTLTVNDLTFDYNSTGVTEISFTGADTVDARVIDHEDAIVEVANNTITVSGLDAGNYTLTVTTIPDANHNPVSVNATITVNKLKTDLTASDITTTYNIDKDLAITLKDASGNPLVDFNVAVVLNGKKTYVTDSNGQVKVSTKGLTPKAYTAKIAFGGNNNYVKSEAEVKVTVNKATPVLTAKAKTFKTSVKSKKYTVTLKDNTGKAIKKAKITLKVKGKTYKATTNSKGKATFKITKLTKKGTYKATITYKGDKYNKKATKKAKIKVKATFKTVSKGSKDKKTVKKIQRALKDNGFYLSYNGHYLKIDGIFHKYTKMAVKQFQKAKDLKVTGKVDEKTAKKLGII